jgi:hypothetical protein
VEPRDGFWLPRSVRQQVLSPETEYTTLSFARGRACAPGDEGAITARWPMLRIEQWDRLLAVLRENRQRAPRREAYWDRFRAALARVGKRFADTAGPLHTSALTALPAYTGYSEPMIRLTLSAMDMWTLDAFAAAFRLAPTLDASAGWQPMAGLSGRLRFYPAGRWQRSMGWLPGRGGRPLFGASSPPDLVVGYGAGNVPGTALMIAFLAQATTLAGGPPPVAVVKNSRREPLFAPLVLSALEDEDPELVATIAVLVWDYGDAALQQYLLAQAGLAIAAAGDGTIAQIGDALRRTLDSGAARFHPHGHKVSFSAIGRDVLARGRQIEAGGPLSIDVVALLAALDSVFWDQHGCLSSRVHFVEIGGDGHYTPLEYASRLTNQLGLLAGFLPRGAWPRQRLHDRFDRYKLLEQTGKVQVLSAYEDEFVVVLDERPLDERGFRAQVNDCEGRVAVVRPVADLMEVPDRYLRMLPAANLQSLSVAVGQVGEGLTDRFLHFADACGVRGVTAIRTVGRAAFPQLAYSWDGLIPLDLVQTRPEGHFTTIEFDAPYDEIIDTYRLFLRQGAALGLAAD